MFFQYNLFIQTVNQISQELCLHELSQDTAVGPAREAFSEKSGGMIIDGHNSSLAIFGKFHKNIDMMRSFFSRARGSILNRCRQFAEAKEKAGFQYGEMTPQMYRRLDAFTQGGKMIRGGLIVLFSKLWGSEEEGFPPAAVNAAAAMEFFQSALLIHDDIMDRDRSRRGGPSFFAAYGEDYRQAGMADAEHLGISTAICGGDISLFLAFELMAGMSMSPPLQVELMELFAREMTWVGMAQTADVVWGGSDEIPRSEDVLHLYRYKTGRYTFSLPMMAGCLIAGMDEDERELVAEAGELLGVVFQIKDDELDLWGDPETTGKPVGTDLKAGKKTLAWIRLWEESSPGEREDLKTILGAQDLSSTQIDGVRQMMEAKGIRRELQKLCEEYSQKARSLLEGLYRSYEKKGFSALSDSPEMYQILQDFIDYNLNRQG